MKTIALITAMDSEFAAVKSLYDFTGTAEEQETEVYGYRLLLKKSGIGKVNGALATQTVCLKGADLVINTGLAGGIDNSLTQGDIVLAEKTSYHDVWCGAPNAKGQIQDLPLYFESPTEMIKKILSLNPSFKNGLVVTGDEFMTDATRLKIVKTDFPSALAVDMESAAVAQTCYLLGVPYLSLRIISDVVGKPEQEEQYRKFWENVPNKAAKMVDAVLRAL